MQFHRTNPAHEMPKLDRTGREDTRLFFCPKCMDRFTVPLAESSVARARCGRCALNWRFIDYEVGVEDEEAEAIYAGFVPFSEREAARSRSLWQ